MEMMNDENDLAKSTGYRCGTCCARPGEQHAADCAEANIARAAIIAADMLADLDPAKVPLAVPAAIGVLRAALAQVHAAKMPTGSLLSPERIEQLLLDHGGFKESRWGPENPTQYHTGKLGAEKLVRAVESEVRSRLAAAPVEQGQGEKAAANSPGEMTAIPLGVSNYVDADGKQRNSYRASPVGAGVVPEGVVPEEPKCQLCGAGKSEECGRAVCGAFYTTPTAATAHPVAADDQVRDQALEDAALACEATPIVTYGLSYNPNEDGHETRENIATAIRALKSRTTAHGGAQGEQA